MKDGTQNLDVLAPVSEPAGEVDIIKAPKELSQKDIDSATRALGIKKIKIKELGHRAVIGDLIQRIGAAKQGSYMLLASENMIQEGIKQLDRMLDGYAHEPEVMAQLAKHRVALIDLWIKAAQAHIKSKRDAGTESPAQTPQNVPFPPSSPVQVNVQVNNMEGEQKPT